jgi:hypothetical protein
MDCPYDVLPRDKQIAVISALTEGCSIRSVERLTSIHRDTIMHLGDESDYHPAAQHRVEKAKDGSTVHSPAQKPVSFSRNGPAHRRC